MKSDDLAPGAPGHLVNIESVRGDRGLAFLPDLLPPVIEMDSSLAAALETAGLALGHLTGLGYALPNPLLFVQTFIRKEALESTRIVGTRADFNQLILFETGSDISSSSDHDSQEVVNYIHTLLIGWEAEPGWLSSKIAIAALHRALMQGVRGQEQRPGVFRDVPVLIGGSRDSLASARFVPPPPNHVWELLDNLTTYANQAKGYPQRIRLAIIHYQFETIHPLLYLSEYFERHRREYIDALYAVSIRGSWRDWILFFLEAVRVQAIDAVRRARLLLTVQVNLRRRYSNDRSPHILGI